MIRNYKYRLYPNKRQEARLQAALDLTRNLYNMALNERIWTYKLTGETVGYYDQSAWLKHYLDAIPGARDFPVTMYRASLKALDEAFKHFFRRVKNGEKPGFPKYKGYHYWNSIGWTEKSGFKVDGNTLKVRGVGRIRARWHREVPETIKTARIKRVAGKWYVTLACEVEARSSVPVTRSAIGIDLGLSQYIVTSDGEQIHTPKWYREAQAELRRVQRSVSRKYQPGKKRRDQSNNWHRAKKRVARLHQKIANQRKWYLENIVCELLRQHDIIAVEDLRIKNMVRNKHLSKSILDSSWGFFLQKLEEKADEWDKVIIRVNPANTTKTCSDCGHIRDDLTLKDRWYDCPECGLSLDRDHNAARNIKQRGLAAYMAQQAA